MAATEPARDLKTELVELERALAERDPTGVPGGLQALITPDFLEFGESGRTWNAQEIVALLAADTAVGVSIGIEQAAADLLADDVALLTYRLTVSGQPPTNRSSVWVRSEGRWRLRFHQGTRAADSAVTG